MKVFDFSDVSINGGYLFEKEKLNRKITINSVYHQFDVSGRIKAFDCDWREGDENKPHFFWDSDVAKWIEGAANILSKHNDPDLSEKIDNIVDKIEKNQGKDGYFNIYFTAITPSMRFKDRDYHELYCAGHLIEAAIACDKIGKHKLLDCMKKYTDYIYQVFVAEKSAAFTTPGHEEIELALVKLYRYTKVKKYLELAEFFIYTRGTEDDVLPEKHNQSHLPVKEQDEAVGHAVRALYLYTGMALLAKENGDKDLLEAARRLFDNIISKKMYVTGGCGSTHIGEAFTNAYDLPNDTSYAETCASIALMFFSNAMLESENDSKYADAVERAFYNGVLSGISLDGKRFFYENALEINLNEHFENKFGAARFPITERPEIFGCSCCPPNLNRLLSSLGNYIYGIENDTLFINQYAKSELSSGEIYCKVDTDYPRTGMVKIKAAGVKMIAFRIPAWCKEFKISRKYFLKNGYAFVDNFDGEIEIEFDMSVREVFANVKVSRDAYKICITRGPVVYCAEAKDNGGELHRFSIPADFEVTEKSDTASALPELDITAEVLKTGDELYSYGLPEITRENLHLIPYSSFANRGTDDMRVWFNISIRS